MPKYTVNFKVNGGAIAADASLLAADSVDYAEAKFSFDSSWNELYKTACFRFLEKVYHVVLENDCCKFPAEVLQNGVCYVSVFGVLENVRATTVEYGIQVQKSGYVKAVPQAQTADPYNYFLEAVTAEKATALVAAAEAENNALAAKQSATTALASEENAAAHETAAFFNAQSAVKSATLAEEYKTAAMQAETAAENSKNSAQQAQLSAETAAKTAQTLYEGILEKERIKTWTETDLDFSNITDLIEKTGFYYTENAVALLLTDYTNGLPNYSYHYFPAKSYFSIYGSVQESIITATVKLYNGKISHTNTENSIQTAATYEFGDLIERVYRKSGPLWVHSSILSETVSKFDIEQATKDLQKDISVNANIERQTSNSLYAPALKGNTVGTVVQIGDRSALHDEAEVKISSKNLIPYPYIMGDAGFNPLPTDEDGNWTWLGVTFQVSSNGEITVSGTATDDIWLALNKFSLPKGTYTFTARPDIIGWGGNYFLRYGDIMSDAGGGEFTVLNENESRKLYLFVTKGYSFEEPTVFKPQIEQGTQATAYTPYVNSFENLRVEKYGKNLLKYPYLNGTQTVSGVDFTDNGDGTVTVNGTATEDISYVLQRKSMFLRPNCTYTVSGCPKGGSTDTYSLVYSDAETGVLFDVGNGSVISTESGTGIEDYHVSIEIKNGTTVSNLTFKPQLEFGANATEYEAYKEPKFYYNPNDNVFNVSLYSGTTTLMTTKVDASLNDYKYLSAVMDCNYSRDINKAFAALEEKLTTAILSTGGNV